MSEMGERLEVIIKEAGIKSNQVLADLLGVSEGAIRHIRKNGSNNKLYIAKIADEYGYNFDWIWSGEGEKDNPKHVPKGSGLVIVKGDEVVTLDEIAVLAGKNEEEFFAHKYFQNKIDLEVSKKFLQLTQDREAFLKFIGADKETT